jgi:hypothetical protein
MCDPPQPASTPYNLGDTVRIYLSPNDPDSQYHGLECEIANRFEDELDAETGRELDKFTYRVRHLDTDATLDVEFRHRDLVPTE